MRTPRLEATREIQAASSFEEGLMLSIIGTLHETPEGQLFAVTGPAAVEGDLESWSRLTGNVIVGRTLEAGGIRWVLRHGAAQTASPARVTSERRLGSRLWLYTNFDCNLSCDYCCVRSSPTAPRRALGLDTVRRIAAEAPPLGTESFFVTGGEPMLLPDIVEILAVLSSSATTTLLTNGSLLKGSMLERVATLDRSRLVFQISVDSPTPELHDLHRGKETWTRALRGVDEALRLGFRVRLAATVSSDEDERRMQVFLDERGVAAEDRVVRRVALRGVASSGVALARADMVPEITVTAEGVFWHPVGAEDEDLLVTGEVFPLADAFRAVALAAAREQELGESLASVFHCA